MITLQTSQDNKDLFANFLNNNEIESKIITKNNFNGQSEIVEIVCALSAVSLPLIAKVIIEAIKAKKPIEAKYKGIQLKGLSEENTVEILKKLIDKK